MNLNAFLSRNRRLLVLCAVSVALHGALLELAAQRVAGQRFASVAPAPAPLALRLAQVAPRPEPEPGLAPASAPPQTASPPSPARAPAPAQPLAAKAGPASAPATAAPKEASPSDQPTGLASMQRMPGRYVVRMPASARLSYRIVTRERQAPDTAYLDWRTDGDRYSLELDGILGRLGSQGAGGDAGILPALAVETRTGGLLRTRFEPGSGEIRFEASGKSAPGNTGMQDRASVLVQLAAIGLGASGPLPDEIRIVVVGAASAEVERYQVLGLEDVATGIGTLPAWHLARAAVPGQPKLELWLAPSQEWLPVQLRLSAVDGSVATQVLAAVERPAAQP